METQAVGMPTLFAGEVTSEVLVWPWHVSPWPDNDEIKKLGESAASLLEQLRLFHRTKPGAKRIYVELPLPGEVGGIEGWDRGDRWMLFHQVGVHDAMGGYHFPTEERTEGTMAGQLSIFFLEEDGESAFRASDGPLIGDLYILQRLTLGKSHEEALAAIMRYTHFDEELMDTCADSLAAARRTVESILAG